MHRRSLSDGGGVILPAGEIGLFAGSGGSGKSRLSLQVAVAAAGVPAGTAEPIPDGTLRVASGPVVMLGYEDAAPWIAWRARRLARWLDDRAGTTHHARAVTDPERLSVAAVDAPLFGVTLGAGRGRGAASGYGREGSAPGGCSAPAIRVSGTGTG